jgi:hypothetical protein
MNPDVHRSGWNALLPIEQPTNVRLLVSVHIDKPFTDRTIEAIQAEQLITI